MLRTGIVMLFICSVSTTGVGADDEVPIRTNEIPGQKLSTGNNTDHGTSPVHSDAGPDGIQPSRPHQITDIRVPLNPVPMRVASVLPVRSPISGPQYVSVPDTPGIVQPVHPVRNRQLYQAPQPVYRNSPGVYSVVSNGVARGPASSAGGIAPGAAGSKSGTPLSPGTALYPSPVPGIPQQIGGTAISSQFLNPHEMLYPHHYRAMYPPYSYKVNGKYMVTPFGVWSHEDWNLQGTVVDVKYKSSISPFALFQSPLRR
ncbi:MAG: hypothetical protein MK110_08320 [Fuerstiella sp.]|nr:hypothetical protein [Fuerstiella sp.]